MKKNKTLILGMGNDILTDDGIGSRIVSDLRTLISNSEVAFDTACCGGLELVEYIKDYAQVIFIDAIRTSSGAPGDVYYYIPSDFRETSHLSNLHDVSFLTALKLFHSMALDLPEELHIIAIEIIEDMEFSDEFSPQLKEKYPDILNQVFEIVNRITN
jgi:hydrogenase maturation protease